MLSRMKTFYKSIREIPRLQSKVEKVRKQQEIDALALKKYVSSNESRTKLLEKRVGLYKVEIKEINKKIYLKEKELLIVNKRLDSLNMQLEDRYIKEKNNELLHKKCKNLLLTTYPETTTKNVGDAMISDSFVKLLNVHTKDIDYVTVFRGTDLDKLDLKYVQNIFAPGFSIVPGTYQKNYRLFKDLDRLKSFNFFPTGCSYQHFLPSDISFNKDLYDSDSVSLLKYLNKLTGPLPVRDKKIERLMSDLGVESFYSGDLVLFDPDVINTNYMGIEKVESLAFSIQHKAKYIGQSISIMKALIKAFPDTKIYITFHGEENSVTEEIRQFAINYNIECIALSGESQNLSFYDKIDFHVGYRLHGHISFLRRRKPSVLLVEDARAYGFAKTGGTSLGCFQAMDGEMVSDKVEFDVLKFIENASSTNFIEYKALFDFIDCQYSEIVEPYFRQVGKLM